MIEKWTYPWLKINRHGKAAQLQNSATAISKTTRWMHGADTTDANGWLTLGFYTKIKFQFLECLAAFKKGSVRIDLVGGG